MKNEPLFDKLLLVISIPAYIRSMEKKELSVVWSIHFFKCPRALTT